MKSINIFHNTVYIEWRLCVKEGVTKKEARIKTSCWNNKTSLHDGNMPGLEAIMRK